MRAHVLISGMVQGVGFRYFVAEKAAELGVTGWAKNKRDGSVEAVFQCMNGWRTVEEDKKKIEELIETCRFGPPLAHVTGLQVKWEDNYDDLLTEFEIR